jgi:dihydroflavonol-4-reductase
MKIFITGGTGFLGSEVVRQLAGTGHELVCLVRESSDVSALNALGITLTSGNITDRESLDKGMRSCDALIHLANVYSFWERDPSIYQRINVEGTRNVMECALESGIRKVVHVSTAVIYGKPQPEDQPFTENSLPGTERFSQYAQSKFEGENIARRLAKEKHLPLVVVQPVSIIGPGDIKASGDYVGNVIKRNLPATGLHDSQITFVHLRDAAQVVIRALEKEDNIGETYIAGKEQITLKQYLKTIAEMANTRLPVLVFPNWLIFRISTILTWFADIFKTPPLWGMSIDQARAFAEGFRANGEKAELELGITYRPVQAAIQESVNWYTEKLKIK